MRILTDQGYVKTVGVFFELDDKQLNRIETNNKYVLDVSFLDECSKSRGENAHIFGVYSVGNNDIIARQLAKLKKEYKSVSWWDRTNNQFIITRR